MKQSDLRGTRKPSRRRAESRSQSSRTALSHGAKGAAIGPPGLEGPPADSRRQDGRGANLARGGSSRLAVNGAVDRQGHAARPVVAKVVGAAVAGVHTGMGRSRRTEDVPGRMIPSTTRGASQ